MNAFISYGNEYPGDNVWVRTSLELLDGIKGKVYLHYYGMTTRDVHKRVVEDANETNRRLSNWQSKSHVWNTPWVLITRNQSLNPRPLSMGLQV
jgi:hypothetical protein